MGGWGNLGGGVTQIIMGTCLYPLFQLGMSADMAWRTVCIVPVLLLHSVAEFYSFVFQMMYPKGTKQDEEDWYHGKIFVCDTLLGLTHCSSSSYTISAPSLSNSIDQRGFK